MSDTKVVNLYKSDYDVYIGRAGKDQDGRFGNPVALNRVCPVCGDFHLDSGSTLDCYEIYLFRRLEYDDSFRDAVKALKGKTLGCFCKPKPCHGDILARYVDSLP